MTEATTLNEISKPGDFDAMAPADQAWCDDVANGLADFGQAVEGLETQRRIEPQERATLQRLLGSLLTSIAANITQLHAFRAWPLARAAEHAAEAWLRATGHANNVPSTPIDFTRHFNAVLEGWAKYCSPPAESGSRVLHLESLAQLDSLPNMTDEQICGIFASGAVTKDETKWGAWLRSTGPVPSPNRERLLAARAGKAEVPKTKTVTTRPSGWPAKCPVLILLRQVAELVD